MIKKNRFASFKVYTFISVKTSKVHGKVSRQYFRNEYIYMYNSWSLPPKESKTYGDWERKSGLFFSEKITSFERRPLVGQPRQVRRLIGKASTCV
jgi:hypothetical protein